MSPSSLPQPLRTALQTAFGAPIVTARSVPGGDINQARRVELADGRCLFLKYRADADAAMFPAEARGLAWLAEPGALRVPRVLAVGGPDRLDGPGFGAREPSSVDNPPRVDSPLPFLALEWIQPGPRPADFEARLGRGLAGVHLAGAPTFGLSEANFLATLPQDNAPEPDWPTFYARRRLAPLVRRAVDAGLAPPDWPRAFERLDVRIHELAGPPEPPARLHGDLWSGNVHRDADGAPCLVDPAVYGGQREMDLAMLALFGAPSPAFFGAYDEIWPLAPGWRDRLPLWQLYPLLAHVCLFGAGYVGGVDQRLRGLLD